MLVYDHIVYKNGKRCDDRIGTFAVQSDAVCIDNTRCYELADVCAIHTDDDELVLHLRDESLVTLRFAQADHVRKAHVCVANRASTTTTAIPASLRKHQHQHIALAASGPTVAWMANDASLNVWKKNDLAAAKIDTTDAVSPDDVQVTGKGNNIATCYDAVNIYDMEKSSIVFCMNAIKGKFIAPSSAGAVHYVAASSAGSNSKPSHASCIKFVDTRSNRIERVVHTNNIYAACPDPDGGMLCVGPNGVYRYESTSGSEYAPLRETIRTPIFAGYSDITRVVKGGDSVLLIHPTTPVLLPLEFADWKEKIPDHIIESSYYPQLPASWTAPVCDGAVCTASNDAEQVVVVLMCNDGKWGAWCPSTGNGDPFMTSDDKNTPLIRGMVADPLNSKFMYVIIRGAHDTPQKVSFRV